MKTMFRAAMLATSVHGIESRLGNNSSSPVFEASMRSCRGRFCARPGPFRGAIRAGRSAAGDETPGLPYPPRGEQSAYPMAYQLWNAAVLRAHERPSLLRWLPRHPRDHRNLRLSLVQQARVLDPNYAIAEELSPAKNRNVRH